MPSKSDNNEDRSAANQFLKKHRWKSGTGRERDSWFLPSKELPRISLFWNSSGKPCMTYNEESTGRGVPMVSNGKKMENFSYGIEEISKANPVLPSGDPENAENEEEDENRLKRTVMKTFVAMRDW